MSDSFTAYLIRLGMTNVWRFRSVFYREYAKRVWHYRCPTSKPHFILKVVT